MDSPHSSKYGCELLSKHADAGLTLKPWSPESSRASCRSLSQLFLLCLIHAQVTTAVEEAAATGQAVEAATTGTVVAATGAVEVDTAGVGTATAGPALATMPQHPTTSPTPYMSPLPATTTPMLTTAVTAMIKLTLTATAAPAQAT
jgi:hypothetical protein